MIKQHVSNQLNVRQCSIVTSDAAGVAGIVRDYSERFLVKVLNSPELPDQARFSWVIIHLQSS